MLEGNQIKQGLLSPLPVIDILRKKKSELIKLCKGFTFY